MAFERSVIGRPATAIGDLSKCVFDKTICQASSSAPCSRNSCSVLLSTAWPSTKLEWFAAMNSSREYVLFLLGPLGRPVKVMDENVVRRSWYPKFSQWVLCHKDSLLPSWRLQGTVVQGLESILCSAFKTPNPRFRLRLHLYTYALLLCNPQAVWLPHVRQWTCTSPYLVYNTAPTSTRMNCIYTYSIPRESRQNRPTIG